jgi:hypothetical protein
MVAALILFDDELAFDTLPIVKIALEELHLVLIAVPLVPSQQAFAAELRVALVTHHHVLQSCSDESFAALFGAELYGGVVSSYVELVEAAVVTLDVAGQLFEEF